MLRIAINETSGFPQTEWMEIEITHGPHEPCLKKDSWYRSFEKYGAELGRLLEENTNDEFLKGLRRELQDG